MNNKLKEYFGMVMSDKSKNFYKIYPHDGIGVFKLSRYRKVQERQRSNNVINTDEIIIVRITTAIFAETEDLAREILISKYKDFLQGNTPPIKIKKIRFLDLNQYTDV